jgi:hypothetical protein
MHSELSEHVIAAIMTGPCRQTQYPVSPSTRFSKKTTNHLHTIGKLKPVDSNNFLFNLSVKHVLVAVEKIKLRRYMLPLFGGIFM